MERITSKSSPTQNPNMKAEVTSAVHFLVNFLRTNRDWAHQSVHQERFTRILINLLCEHYRSHWFPDQPLRGSGYRCLRINDMLMEPLVAKAGHLVGISLEEMQVLLPSELTVWVDPEEVSYRIGEEGSICVLYDGVTKTTSETRLNALDLLNCKMRMRNKKNGSHHPALDSTDFNQTQNDVTVHA